MTRVTALSAFLLAAAVPARSLDLALPDCLGRAAERSQQALQGRLSAEQAAGAAREAGTGRLPRLFALGSWDKSDDPTTQLPDANKAVLRLEQSLNPLSPEWIAAKRGRVELSAAELESLQARRDAERQARRLYYGVLQDREATASLDAVRLQLDKLLTAVLPRYSMNRVPPFDLVKVKSAIADLEKTRGERAAALAGQTAELAQTLGLDATAQLALAPVDQEPAAPSDDEVLRAVTANPGLHALSERAAAARLAVAAARAARLPELTGAGEYGWAGQTPSDVSRGWDVSVTMRLPVFDWGAISSRARQQKAGAALAESRLELERQGLIAQALRTRAQAASDLAAAGRRRALLADARQAAAASVDRYRLGAASVLEATEAVNLWLSTLLDERAAHYAYLSDLADLAWIEGRAPGADGL